MTKKRSPGEGNIRQLPSGKWFGQIMDGYTSDGKKNIVSFTAAKKSEVVAKIQEYRANREKAKNVGQNLLLKEWSDRWYQDYADQVQPSTYSGYRFTLNIIQQHLGHRRLNSLLPMDVEAFLRKLKESYSDSRVSKCRAMLIQIYDAAEANELVVRNPARKAKKLRTVQTVVLPDSKQAETSGKDAFTPEEVEALLTGLNNDLTGNSIRLMIGTGMRVQELLALTKDDIAEDGASIRIDKAVKTVEGKSTLGPPKSASGNRTIPVPASYRAAALYVRENGSTPFLWTSSWKNPLYSVASFRDKFYRAIKKIDGVRPLSPHCCRHTYITLLQSKGVPMETIARLAGHSAIETTDHYLHISADTLSAAVTVLDSNENKEAI